MAKKQPTTYTCPRCGTVGLTYMDVPHRECPNPRKIEVEYEPTWVVTLSDGTTHGADDVDELFDLLNEDDHAVYVHRIQRHRRVRD